MVTRTEHIWIVNLRIDGNEFVGTFPRAAPPTRRSNLRMTDP